MKEALIALSRSGIMTRTILAREIKSREHARKLWPLVTPLPPHQLLTYVSPAFNSDDALLRRGHFRTLPGARSLDVVAHFDKEEAERLKSTSESAEHVRAKELIAAALTARLEANRAMPWSFADPDASDFHLHGNLLLGAESVSTELNVRTAFGASYRLDVGILSKPIGKKPLILGGIEIERSHAFDGRKALIAKSQAFPLISVDITGMSLDDITPQWADQALTATTASHSTGKRSTFVYLHDLLYPLYIQLPPILGDSGKSHQFLIFASDEELGKLLKWVKKLADSVGLKESQDFSVAPVRAKSAQSEKMLLNAGEVVGSGWEKVNPDQCIRLTIQRPRSVLDVPAYLFHLTLAKLLLIDVDALVGYKYQNGIYNDDPQEDVWVHSKWISETKSYSRHRILPKRLAEPNSTIMNLLQGLAGGSSSSST
ncbi:hypothetical protein [Duganella violaceipulchra]|uniref:Uncharacterized protein n=1 Tax=Duganella violaceipulchra TaxID=2849652 RepID=A0AA41H951_9BURK|nr:hypothetical protein [Duganella violaceicalia]MBV6322156.1 hypothetical protein [Duganella violaceicalia]MCP2011301.1 hypothetical protein [Duganella violaceicalia]